MFCVWQKFHWTPSPLQPQSEQACVGTAILSASGHADQELPSGPIHSWRADSRRHWESETKQEGWDQTTQTDGDIYSSVLIPGHKCTDVNAYFPYTFKNSFFTVVSSLAEWESQREESACDSPQQTGQLRRYSNTTLLLCLNLGWFTGCLSVCICWCLSACKSASTEPTCNLIFVFREQEANKRGSNIMWFLLYYDSLETS